MAMDTTTPRSRRALLTAAAGAGAATAIQAVARPLSAQAVTEGVSYTNNETAATVISGTSQSQSGFRDSGSGTGVYGASTSSTGVYGNSSSGTRVYASSDSGTGVYGNSSSGTGVYGYSTSSTGVSGYSTSSTGVSGYSTSSTGVYGYSGSGRGAVFSGKLAQVRLSPSTDATHPASGKLGDLFLDKNKRLWFCKGGTTWKQLA